ncbi:nad binding rossmann fold-containing protein [Zalerion maritima]|uniref:Nad binding rossmann fold-containing protein n=1 Tax=Zalerion maritima TaxID=339359 RepID=A0AAD5RI59_9PEZI|nr:nad binding rossmann fold-containing protein [Zalerion maritima]
MASSKVYNVGIVGWGLAAHVFHIPYITQIPQLNLVGGVTSRANAVKAPLKHYSTAKDLFADPTVDVVVIGTPPNSHFDYVTQALNAGKHVLCEKPFVPTSAEAENLGALAKEKGKVLCVYQNRRWDSDFLTVKKLIADGTLGRVYEFETHFDRYRPKASESPWKNDLSWDDGGGPLFDIGTHLIDQAVTIFGKPDEVYGRFACQRGDGTGEIDSITAMLSYGKGMDVIVKAGAVSCEKHQPRFWIRGTKGSFRKGGMDPQEDQLKAGTGDRKEDVWQREDFGVEPKENAGTLCVAGKGDEITEKVYPTVKPETYTAIYKELVKAIASGREDDIPVPASQAALVLRIIEGLRKSAASGGKVTI